MSIFVSEVSFFFVFVFTVNHMTKGFSFFHPEIAIVCSQPRSNKRLSGLGPRRQWFQSFELRGFGLKSGRTLLHSWGEFVMHGAAMYSSQFFRGPALGLTRARKRNCRNLWPVSRCSLGSLLLWRPV